jgi:hypothetical protein
MLGAPTAVIKIIMKRKIRNPFQESNPHCPVHHITDSATIMALQKSNKRSSYFEKTAK